MIMLRRSLSLLKSIVCSTLVMHFAIMKFSYALTYSTTTTDSYDASHTVQYNVDSGDDQYGDMFIGSYDLTTDPTESVNLAENNKEITTATQEIFEKLVKSKILGDWDYPDYTKSTEAWDLLGGITPWINISSPTAVPVIEQKYFNSDAPNIIFFLADDWGYNDVGYQSTYMNWTTPNIDSAAASGIKLTNYYSHERCIPSRAALLTGRYAARFGLHGDNILVELPVNEATLAQELKSAGYRTHLVGKWHLGTSTYSKLPTYRGFDSFYGFYGGYIDYYEKTWEGRLDLHENEAFVTDSYALSSETFSAFLYGQKTEAIIADHAENYDGHQPLFLMYSSQLVHFPWLAPDRFMQRCSDKSATNDQQLYCAMNLILDEAFANLTCALERYDMMDNTLIVVSSDNGGSDAAQGSNFPFRGHKNNVFRGGLSVPAFLYGDVIPDYLRGTTYAEQLHITDWLPTLMGLATKNEWSGSMIHSTIDGADMWSSVMKNSSTPHPTILHYLDVNDTMAYQKHMTKSIIVKIPSNYSDPFILSDDNEDSALASISCSVPNYLLLPPDGDDSFWAVQDEGSTFFILIFSFLLLSTLLLTLSLIVRRVFVILYNRANGIHSNFGLIRKVVDSVDTGPIECDVGESLPLLYDPSKPNTAPVSLGFSTNSMRTEDV